MNKIKSLLALATLLAVIPPASAGIKKIGTINGIDIYRVRTASVFAPSSTVIVAADPKRPGTVEVLNGTGGPGFVPACATAGGIAGGAALLRPARTENNNGSSAGSSSTASGTGTATGGAGGPSSPGWIPPGHR